MRRSLLPPPGRWAPFLVLIACLLASGSFVPASQVRPLNLEEMTLRADRVFRGRCTHVRADVDADLGQVVTDVTFAVLRSAKADLHGQVTIRLLGDRTADPRDRDFVGIPQFRPGEEVVLFLYGNSKQGLTSPVGLGQGKFAITRDKLGHGRALNAHSNETLFQNLSPGAIKTLGDVARTSPRSGLDPDLLLDLVAKLSREP